MVEQLASLLLPIDALLAHQDFNPHLDASSAFVSLFRDLWFLCLLFHFTSVGDKEETALDWLKPALARIAFKSPSVVLEESRDLNASDVEYNSVIRQEYAHTVSNMLCEFLPCCNRITSTGDLQTSYGAYQAHTYTWRGYSFSIIWTSGFHPNNA